MVGNIYTDTLYTTHCTVCNSYAHVQCSVYTVHCIVDTTVCNVHILPIGTKKHLVLFMSLHFTVKLTMQWLFALILA